MYQLSLCLAGKVFSLDVSKNLNVLYWSGVRSTAALFERNMGSGSFWKASIMTLHCDNVLVAVHLGHCCTGSRHKALAKRTLLGQVTSIGFLPWQLFPTLIPCVPIIAYVPVYNHCQELKDWKTSLEIKSSTASLAQWIPFYPDWSIYSSVSNVTSNSRLNKLINWEHTDLLTCLLTKRQLFAWPRSKDLVKTWKLTSPE